MATAGPLHHKLVLKHWKECSLVYDLYAEICGHHQQSDCRPASQGAQAQALLSSLPQDDTLCLLLIAQGGLALMDAAATML